MQHLHLRRKLVACQAVLRQWRGHKRSNVQQPAPAGRPAHGKTRNDAHAGRKGGTKGASPVCAAAHSLNFLQTMNKKSVGMVTAAVLPSHSDGYSKLIDVPERLKHGIVLAPPFPADSYSGRVQVSWAAQIMASQTSKGQQTQQQATPCEQTRPALVPCFGVDRDSARLHCKHVSGKSAGITAGQLMRAPDPRCSKCHGMPWHCAHSPLHRPAI